MALRNSAVLLIFGLLSALVPTLPAWADPLADGDIPVDACDSLRLQGKCKPAPLTAEHNMPKQVLTGNKVAVRRSLTLPAQQAAGKAGTCDAHLRISYAQMNDKIKVETTVTNDSCAASHGDYVLRIRTLSEAGKALTRSVPGSWSRHDNEVVQSTQSYPMENARDLVWVRINSNPSSACFCD